MMRARDDRAFRQGCNSEMGDIRFDFLLFFLTGFIKIRVSMRLVGGTVTVCRNTPLKVPSEVRALRNNNA